ncbi:MAG: hypothetical protein HQM10_20785 [Candidatus Riflebacteria bacterium]|nr:hypothetical protein [Candidatus Riflebacteria bacterium]
MLRASIFCILMICFCSTAFSRTDDDARYSPPQNLSLELVSSGTKYVGTVKVLLGSPSGLEIFFESSVDLSVNRPSEKIEKLASNSVLTFEFSADKQKNLPGSDGTWLRMRIVYLPDYSAQKVYLSDVKKYPAQEERIRVLKIVEANEKAAARQTDSVRYFVR